MQTLFSFLRKNTMVKLNQILRWLKKPKVLRLVCLASSVVGLLCYALSSSFNHLLGNWSWWKMLLYIVFSFIICFSVLFAPARSRSTSLRLESHVSFLVLIITSVYSFLFDNFVKGTPDAYSLVSCAAFATMSLGLSNLTQFGFQIDLLYFFCGGLLVQLMKIKFWLFIVGGGFSYSLLQLCDYPRHRQGENLPLQLQNLVNIQVDPRSISSSSHEEADADGIQQQLMNCIKELEKENRKLVPFVSRHVDKYLRAVFYIKEEPHADVNLLSPSEIMRRMYEIMRRLKEIVNLMVDAGFVEECSDIYSTFRMEFLEQCLQELELEFEMLNNDEVLKLSEASKAAWKMFFPDEATLCSYLFSGLSVVADVSFKKVCKRVLEFTHITITTKNYSRNLLFNIVPKMLESLRELDLMFNARENFSFGPDLGDILRLLAMVNRFRDIIYPGNVQAPVTHEEIKHITAESMNYIRRRCEFWKTGNDGQPGRLGNSSFWVVIGRMVDLLESEVEAISKHFYAGNKMHYHFMANCLFYISRRTRDFNMDNEWFQQRRAKVTRYSELYTEYARNEILENRERRLLYDPFIYPEETEDKKTV